MSNLNIITGTMFSGKTSYLIKKAKKLSLNKKIIFISHKFDLIRSNKNKIYTNDNKKQKLKFVNIVFVDDLSNISIKNYDIIFIDEFQFFNFSKEIILNWLNEYPNKIFYISGLNINWKMEKWGSILDLIPYSSNIKILYSNCFSCLKNNKKEKAIFTIKNSNNNTDIEIGSNNIYETLCFNCYQKRK